MTKKAESPFKIGDRVSWEFHGARKTGVVYAVEWIRNDGGFWKIGASSNAKPPHPVTNSQGDFLAASSRKFTKLPDADKSRQDK
jgi:hypothetical protein